MQLHWKSNNQLKTLKQNKNHVANEKYGERAGVRNQHKIKRN